MRLRPPSVFSKARIGSLLSVLVVTITFALGTLPPASAVAFPAFPPVTVNTATGSQLYPGAQEGSCTYQNYFYSFWVDGSKFLWVSSSTDGVTWSTPVNLETLTGLGTIGTPSGVGALQQTFRITCNGNTMAVLWTSVNYNGNPNTLTNIMNFNTGTMSGGVVTMGSPTQGPKTASGAAAKFTQTALQFNAFSLLNGQIFYMMNVYVTAGIGVSIIQNNNIVANLSTANYAYTGYPADFLYDGSVFMIYFAGHCQVAVSGDGISWPASPTTLSATYCTGAAALINPAIDTTYNNAFYIGSLATPNTYILKLGNSGNFLANYTVPATGTPLGVSVTADGDGDFVVFVCNTGHACVYSYTNNAFSTLSAGTSITFPGGVFGTSIGYWTLAIEAYFSQTLESFAVQSATTAGSPFYIYETVFGTPLTVLSVQGQQTIGSCTNAGGTFTLTNQTLYMYQGTALQNEVVSTIQVNINAVAGSTGTHTIQLVIYSTPAAGAISPSNLLTLNYAKQIALTSGTGASTITLAISGLNLANGAIWGVGIVGDNKVTLSTSGFSGLITYSGVPLPTSQQNSFFTTQGTSSTTQLSLCATALYQIVQTVTVTSTTTQAATTTVTATSTVNTINAQVLFANNQNWPIIFLLLFLPCGILLGVTKNLSGGVVGLLIGSVICLMAGVIPAYIFTGLLIGIVAMMVLIQRSGPNG